MMPEGKEVCREVATQAQNRMRSQHLTIIQFNKKGSPFDLKQFCVKEIEGVLNLWRDDGSEHLFLCIGLLYVAI